MTPSKRSVHRLLAVLLGLVAGLLLTEAVARFFLPASWPQRLPLVRYEADGHCGYKHRPGQEAWTLSGRARINRQGFRGADWKLEKEPGLIRVALLGDSYVFGHGVHDEETTAVLLEQLLNARSGGDRRFEVFNFGVVGHHLGHSIGVLEHHAVRFQPDIVLLHFTLNDVIQGAIDPDVYRQVFAGEAERFSPWRFRLRELARRSRLAMRLHDVWLAHTPSAMRLVSQAYLHEGVLPPDGPVPTWGAVRDQLAEAARLGREHGFRVALVIVPHPEEVLDPGLEASYQGYLLEQAMRLGVPPLDLLPALRDAREEPEALLIPYDNHFSPAGHRIVAESLAGAVLELAAR